MGLQTDSLIVVSTIKQHDFILRIIKIFSQKGFFIFQHCHTLQWFQTTLVTIARFSLCCQLCIKCFLSLGQVLPLFYDSNEDVIEFVFFYYFYSKLQRFFTALTFYYWAPAIIRFYFHLSHTCLLLFHQRMIYAKQRPFCRLIFNDC